MLSGTAHLLTFADGPALLAGRHLAPVRVDAANFPLNWIAYSSDESGQDEVSVRPFRGTGRTPVTTRGGTEPAWAPDGTRLFYRSGDRLEWVDVQTDPMFRVLSPPQTLFQGRFYSWNWSQQYDVHPDGDGFLMFQDESDESELTVVVGFVEELMERVEN